MNFGLHPLGDSPYVKLLPFPSWIHLFMDAQVNRKCAQMHLFLAACHLPVIISIGIRWGNTYCASLINNKLIIMSERPCGSNCPNKTWAVNATGMMFQVWTYQMIYFLSPRLYSQGRSLISYTCLRNDFSIYFESIFSRSFISCSKSRGSFWLEWENHFCLL